MMKQKMVMCLLTGVLVLGIGGCGTQEVEVPEVENVETAEEEPVPEETAEEEGDEQEKTDEEDNSNNSLHWSIIHTIGHICFCRRIYTL